MQPDYCAPTDVAVGCISSNRKGKKMKKGILVIVFVVSLTLLLTPTYAAISSWVAKASMPTSRGQAAVIAGDNGLIYVMGGFPSGPDGGELSTVEAYDPATDTWTAKASMLKNTRGSAVAKGLDGVIYVIGGWDPDLPGSGLTNVGGSETGGNSWINHMQAYNPVTDTWTLKAPIPLAVWEAGAATGDDGKIYVIGGENGVDPNYETDRVQVYDPATDTWTTKTPMPTPRIYHGVVKDKDGLIYAIAGYSRALGTAISTVEAYNPATDTWTTKASMPIRVCQFGSTLVCDGKIYVMGGGTSYSNNDPPFYDSVYSYDPTTDTWSTELPMPTARRELGAAYSVKLYAIGGGNTNHFGPYGNWNEEATITPTPPPHVIPEVPMGTMVGVIAMFGALLSFGVVRKRKWLNGNLQIR